MRDALVSLGRDGLKGLVERLGRPLSNTGWDKAPLNELARDLVSQAEAESWSLGLGLGLRQAANPTDPRVQELLRVPGLRSEFVNARPALVALDGARPPSPADQAALSYPPERLRADGQRLAPEQQGRLIGALKALDDDRPRLAALVARLGHSLDVEIGGPGLPAPELRRALVNAAEDQSWSLGLALAIAQECPQDSFVQKLLADDTLSPRLRGGQLWNVAAPELGLDQLRGLSSALRNELGAWVLPGNTGLARDVAVETFEDGKATLFVSVPILPRDAYDFLSGRVEVELPAGTSEEAAKAALRQAAFSKALELHLEDWVTGQLSMWSQGQHIAVRLESDASGKPHVQVVSKGGILHNLDLDWTRYVRPLADRDDTSPFASREAELFRMIERGLQV